jgi:excisionase family DNA binding protein
MIDETYLTSDEVCSRLKIARQTLAAIRDRGELPFVRLSPRKLYYRASDVDALLSPTTVR